MRIDLIVAALALALAGAGCGGDDDTESTISPTTSTTTTAAAGDLVEQVNTICIEGDKELTAVQNEVAQDESLDAYVDAVAPVIQGTLDEIAALPGAGDDPGISEFVELSQQALDDLEADPQLLAGGKNPFAAAYRVGREAGLDACIPN